MTNGEARTRFLVAVKQRRTLLERRLIEAPKDSRPTIRAEIKSCIRLQGLLDRRFPEPEIVVKEPGVL